MATKGKVLIATGGGHIDFSRAIATTAEYAYSRGYEPYAAIGGWKSIAEIMRDSSTRDRWIRPIPTDNATLKRILRTRASCLRSSRTRFKNDDEIEFFRNFAREYVAVIAMGGEDTNSMVLLLPNGIGWPKTMDNNLGPNSYTDNLEPGTYFTIGYPSFIEVAADQTLGSLHNAFTNGTTKVNVYFGRNQDWCVLMSALYGCAGVIVPCEDNDKEGKSFEAFYQQVEAERARNKDIYGVPFCNVSMAEGAWLEGMEEFAPKGLIQYLNNPEWVEKDAYHHPKIKPDIMGQLICDALKKRSSGKIKARPKVITYHGRDGRACDLDQRGSRIVSMKAVDMIDEGGFGSMAAVHHENGEWVPGKVPIQSAVQERYVRDCGMFDYETGRFSESFLAYGERMFGKPPQVDEELVVL